jgi:glycosyltransferase involved in cell wall biosynthesis
MPMVAVIGLNGLALRPNGSGVQTYCRELLVRLPAAVRAEVVARVQSDALSEVPPTVRPLPVRPCDGARRAWEGLRSLGPCDLVHGLDVDLPARPGAPTVATVHDLSVFDVPWAFSRRRALGERLIVRQAIRRADALIVDSAFTAERVHALFGRAATVVPLAPAPDFAPADAAAVRDVRKRYQLPDRFVLHVGTLEPRKDVSTLASACEAAGIPLVMAGRGTGPRNAVVLGYVPRDDLPALYGSATVVGYVSLYEGFGLPPLEAMACGAAVVATRVGALPEVLAASAELVPPGDIGALTAALRRLTEDDDLRAHAATEGQRQAARFTWEATAEATANVYRTLGLPA